MNLGLEGSSVLVTGAAGGLGLAVCRCFAAEGAQVMLADIDPVRVEDAVSDVGGAGAVAGDVSDPVDAARIVDETVARLGGLDVLVTAAGIYQGTPLDRIQPDEWDCLQAVNVRGTFLSAQAALRVMTARRRGVIITLGSVAGQLGGVQSGAAYATSKAAVSGMTKSLARYAGPYGVRVNCVNPGYIEAGMSLGMTAEDRERTIGLTPLGRAGTADEVANAIVWLASDAASFVTGAHVDVNGGLLMA
jgi:3-oxoacyl-[acyl-carrier protein] reductase